MVLTDGSYDSSEPKRALRIHVPLSNAQVALIREELANLVVLLVGPIVKIRRDVEVVSGAIQQLTEDGLGSAKQVSSYMFLMRGAPVAKRVTSHALCNVPVFYQFAVVGTLVTRVVLRVRFLVIVRGMNGTYRCHHLPPRRCRFQAVEAATFEPSADPLGPSSITVPQACR